MSRVTKFRGLTLDGKWLYTSNEVLMSFDNGFAFMPGRGEGATIIALQTETLGQFSGLRDKNGIAVFQGDVVKCSSGCPHEVVWLDEVPNSNLGGMPGFYLSGLNEGYSWMGVEEVIGNIHENAELLEEA